MLKYSDYVFKLAISICRAAVIPLFNPYEEETLKDDKG
jgi:hypothetical protein